MNAIIKIKRAPVYVHKKINHQTFYTISMKLWKKLDNFRNIFIYKNQDNLR